MDVVSTCPLRVGSIVWQPRPSAWTLTVICKATFALIPGESRLADAQDELTTQDRPASSGAATSLQATTDLVPWKRRADVLVVGSAYAPQQRPARVVSTRVNVGEIDKRLDVWCDRVFWKDGRLLEGQPFTQMPLAYERAAGGPGTANPAGMRFDAAPDAYGSVPIPNLQPAGIVVARPGDTFTAVGYGPLAPTWPVRADKLSRHAEGWSHEGWSARPLAADFDLGYFNSAPPDQQITAIRAEERILLENLHREHPLLITRLPGLRPCAHTTTGGRLDEEIELVADTLTIDTDRGVATVVWRGRLALSHPREEGRIVVSMPAAGSAAQPSRASGAALDPTQQLGGPGVEESGTLQLPRGEIAAILANLRNPGAPALPFKETPSVWTGAQTGPAPAASPAVLPEDTGTLYGARRPDRDALPFAPKVAKPVPAPAPEPEWIPPARVDIPAPVADLPLPEGSEEPTEEKVAHTPPPVQPRPLFEEYPIERFGAITASVARRRAETARILDEARLDATTWAEVSQHWNDAMAKEIARGRTALLNAFDAAYVARLEEERGPIRAEDYARLQVAAERGTMGETLVEMTLPRGAVIRIERVWMARIADDRQLGKSVRAAVKAAREA